MKEDAKEKNNSPSAMKSKGILIAMVAIMAVAVIAIIVLVVSGVFGTKEIRLYNGINNLKPGSYLCVNNEGEYINGYIITDESDDRDEFIFGGDETTSLVLKPGQRLKISDSDNVDILCTRQ